MLTASQISAVAIALIVFLGLVIPGVTRYVLLGGTAILVAFTIAWGGGHGPLAELLH